MLKRIRQHPVFTAGIAVVGIVSALAIFVDALNGVPTFFDTTLPWMVQRVTAFGVSLNVQLMVSMTLFGISLAFLVLIYRATTRKATGASAAGASGTDVQMRPATDTSKEVMSELDDATEDRPAPRQAMQMARSDTPSSQVALKAAADVATGYGAAHDARVITRERGDYLSGFADADGRPLRYCPYCPFQTSDNASEIDKHIEADHRLDPGHVQDWYDEPQPWANIPMYFDPPPERQAEYFNGVPADSTRTIYVSGRRAAELSTPLQAGRRSVHVASRRELLPNHGSFWATTTLET